MAVFLKNLDGLVDGAATSGGRKHRPVVGVPEGRKKTVFLEHEVGWIFLERRAIDLRIFVLVK